MLRLLMCSVLLMVPVSYVHGFEEGDANEDGEVDTDDREDILPLFNNPGSRTWADGDFNNDGCVTDYDWAIWNLNRTDYSNFPGDFNDNGTVEQGDLDFILFNWGKSYSGPETDIIDSVGPVYDQRVNPLSAKWTVRWIHDPPTDGKVDQDDLDRVLNNWGKTRQ